MARVRRCQICDRETEDKDLDNHAICRRCNDGFNQPIQEKGPRQYARFDVAPPANGIHIAGPMEDGLQHCERCGALLAHQRVDDSMGPIPLGTSIPLTCYAVNAFIERGRGWQAVYLGPRPADCEPVR